MFTVQHDIINSANSIRRAAVQLSRDLLMDHVETGQELTAMSERLAAIASILEQAESIIAVLPPIPEAIKMAESAFSALPPNNHT